MRKGRNSTNSNLLLVLGKKTCLATWQLQSLFSHNRERFVYVNAVSSQGAELSTYYAKPDYPTIDMGNIANEFVRWCLVVLWTLCHSIRDVLRYLLPSRYSVTMQSRPSAPWSLDNKASHLVQRQTLHSSITAYLRPSLPSPSSFSNTQTRSRCIHVQLYSPHLSLPTLSCRQLKLFNSPGPQRTRDSISRSLSQSRGTPQREACLSLKPAHSNSGSTRFWAAIASIAPAG